MADNRKKLLIDPKFQIWFLSYTSGMALILSVIYFLANEYFFNSFTQMGQTAGLPIDHVFFQFIQEQKQISNWIFLVTTIISVILILLFGLYISNQIAGPLYQLKTYLLSWKNGDRTPLSFRKKDHFQDLAKVVNDCLVSENKASKGP